MFLVCLGAGTPPLLRVGIWTVDGTEAAPGRCGPSSGVARGSWKSSIDAVHVVIEKKVHATPRLLTDEEIHRDKWKCRLCAEVALHIGFESPGSARGWRKKAV